MIIVTQKNSDIDFQIINYQHIATITCYGNEVVAHMAVGAPHMVVILGRYPSAEIATKVATNIAMTYGKHIRVNRVHQTMEYVYPVEAYDYPKVFYMPDYDKEAQDG